MKAQVYLLTAGIVIATLVALRAFITVQQISSERDILEVSLEDSTFTNIENEVKQVIRISSNSPGTISNNAIDFLNFTRRGSQGRSLDLTTLFVGVLANSTNQTMNITVFQFLRESNLNVTIRLNSSTEQRNSTLLNDGDIWLNNFSFTPGQTFILTVTLPSKNYLENIIVETKSDKSTYTGFYDLKVISKRATHASKFQQGIKLS